MRWRRVLRLARAADRRHQDGTLTPRAVRAWKRLAKHDAVAWIWLRDPREDTWPYAREVLTPTDVFAAAVHPDRAPASRAAIGAFCVRNELLPEQPADRVVFFVMTGDQERYQAVDPDGTVLADVYQHATERTRAALRATVVGAGDLDLVRVITNRPDRAITSAEAGYLARGLADAGEWARLWAAIPAMRLADAVAAARRFGDWRPDTETGRAYLARLLAARPILLDTPANALVTRISTDIAYDFSFTPNSSELAVAFVDGITVYEPLSGRVTGEYEVRASVRRGDGHLVRGYDDLVALGGGAVVYRRGDEIVHGSPDRGVRTVLTTKDRPTLGQTPDGFVAVEGWTVYVGTREDSSVRVERREVPDVDRWTRPHFLCVDPMSGHLVFMARDGDQHQVLLLFDAELRLLARTRCPYMASDAAFSGPDRIVMGGTVWRRAGANLVLVNDGVGGEVVGPAQVLVRGPVGPMWLDPETGKPTTGLADLPSTWDRAKISADGAFVAVSARGVHVHDALLRTLSDLPSWRLSAATITDLRTVARLEKRQYIPLIAEAVALVRAGLEHRFGGDVAIGGTASIPAHGDDIALGGG